MSRSYKKSPFFGDTTSKNMKRVANKKVRRTLDIVSGCQYKRVFCSWQIKDYWSYYSKESAIADDKNNKNKIVYTNLSNEYPKGHSSILNWEKGMRK